MPASRSRRPSSASCSTTTATNVLVALPMFHATSGSTGPEAGSTAVVPAVTSVTAPSPSGSAMRAPTNSPAPRWDSRMLRSAPAVGDGSAAAAVVVDGAAVVVGVAAATVTVDVGAATVVGGAVAGAAGRAAAPPSDEHAVA